MTKFEIIGSIIGALETIARVIPTKRNFAPIGIAINILHSISEFLNRKTVDK